MGLFLIILLPAMDPDLGWQLKCGQLIFQRQGFCRQNQFSSLLDGYQWVNHHWLYQLVLFILWKNFGFWGLSVFNALIVSITFFIFHKLIKDYHLEKKLAIILILFFSWGVFSFGIRSQLLGIFYLALIFFCWFQKKEIYLPLIFLFWANTHGSVVLGLIILNLLFLQDLRALKKKGLILTSSFLATLINPSGFGIFQEAWRHFSSVPLENLIAEWVPPIFQKQILILLLTVISLFSIPYFYWPLMVLFAFLSLKARRHLPFFFFGFFLLFFRSKKPMVQLQSWLKKKSLRKDLAILTSWLVFFYGLFLRVPQTIKINSSWQNYCQASIVGYPCQAVEFLKKQPGSENLFNRYEWGGFLIWQLPDKKVFVDGRMPAWPTSSDKSPYTIYLETLQTQPGWQQILDKYDIKWILISPGTFMDLKLAPKPEEFDWQEAYRDKISVVYKRIELNENFRD